ncbi:MAG: hypothetical protein ACI8T1_001826 [Verrucomicrobiales bacterium]
MVGGVPHVITFDASKGAFKAVREGSEDPVPLTMVLTANWRREQPEGNVYLVSMLEKAKTYLVKKGAEGWRYYDDVGAPPVDWAKAAFDAAKWNEGTAPLGYGESVPTTLSFSGDSQNKTMTAYFRKTIQVEDPSEIVKGYAGIECDDGAFIYLNGVEVHRVRMGDDAKDTHKTATATDERGEKGTTDQFFIDNSLLKKGDNVIAVSVYQADAQSSDLYMNFDLRVVTKADIKEKK